jgi:hypothetical protein
VKKTEFGGVQGKSWRAGGCRDHLPRSISVVDLFAANGMSSFREMDANLVRPTRLQSAPEEGMFRKSFRDVHVSHRVLSTRRVRTAPPSITAVAELRRDRAAGTRDLPRQQFDRWNREREVAIRDKCCHLCRKLE